MLFILFEVLIQGFLVLIFTIASYKILQSYKIVDVRWDHQLIFAAIVVIITYGIVFFLNSILTHYFSLILPDLYLGGIRIILILGAYIYMYSRYKEIITRYIKEAIKTVIAGFILYILFSWIIGGIVVSYFYSTLL